MVEVVGVAVVVPLKVYELELVLDAEDETVVKADVAIGELDFLIYVGTL